MSFSEPLKARPIGERAPDTITASGTAKPFLVDCSYPGEWPDPVDMSPKATPVGAEPAASARVDEHLMEAVVPVRARCAGRRAQPRDVQPGMPVGCVTSRSRAQRSRQGVPIG